MEQISTEKLYELYQDTLNRCGTYLLTEDDDVIEYNIFEEFDIGVHSFFHLDNLTILQKEGFISERKMKLSNLIRDKVIGLQRTNLWNIESLKSSEQWKEVLSLCDSIKSIG